MLEYRLGAGEHFVTVLGRVDWRQQWVDISSDTRGLAIANNGRYACSAEANELRMTIPPQPAVRLPRYVPARGL